MQERPSYGKLEDYRHLVMPMQYEILQYLEGKQQATSDCDKHLQLFSLVPTAQGCDCSHVRICSNGLHELLKRSGFNVPAEGVAWGTVADQFWRRLFCIDKLETDNRKFADEIPTDGK